jgi:SagB-type dehydrogenase family enzyme
MSDPFFEFFYKDRPSVDPDSPEWREVSFKKYPRSPRILLPRPRPLGAVSLEEALKRRKTERDFSAKPLPLDILGSLFFWSFGLIHKEANTSGNGLVFRRPYPSGGARFPVEIYFAAFRIKDLKKGAYHYNFREHALERIATADIENIRESLSYDFAKKSAGLILLSFIGERAMRKYGSLGYKLGLLEGGHIGQNIYLIGAALGLGVLALGGMNYNVVHRELDLDSNDETLFYQLAVGWPAHASSAAAVDNNSCKMSR